jgi:TorA maturation chaperone TorD
MQNLQTTNTVELDLQKSIAASDMYQLLAMFLHLPTKEMVAGILDGTLAEDVLTIFEELGFLDHREGIKTKLEALSGEISGQEEFFTGMRREYTRLFTHPKEPAVDIYETMFLYQPEEGEKGKPALFISPAALDAERCYRQAGLVRSKEVNEPGDHMATEMEFMAYLYVQKARALQENNQEELSKRNKQIREFSEAHLQKWAIDFFDKCAFASKTDVYRVFSQIGSIFIRNVLDRAISENK